MDHVASGQDATHPSDSMATRSRADSILNLVVSHSGESESKQEQPESIRAMDRKSNPTVAATSTSERAQRQAERTASRY